MGEKSLKSVRPLDEYKEDRLDSSFPPEYSGGKQVRDGTAN
jgi:hypothetical protein